MNKNDLLKQRAGVFRVLLQSKANSNPDAQLLLRWLTPLFEEIEQGKVVPPIRYQYRMALGKDSSFYEPSSPFSECEAQFIAALEDWYSQPWFNPPEDIKR